ncbi:AMP-binding protein, partial [Candidatus Bipolaricaulota bacterium]|nr:AMP-binding protein [Candidatus Bipolaricaulota bacterium]
MRTLSEVLSETTAAFPDRNVIADGAQRITYRNLDERVNHVARGLIELGVAKGDKVGLWMPNMPEWVIAYFAIARIGAVVVPVNTRYKPHEVSYILQNSEATTLFMVDTFVGIDYLEMLGKIRGALPFLKHVIVCGQKGSNTYTFDEIAGLGMTHVNDGKVAERATQCDPNDNVFILYTSGTTGNPKGAMLSHHNIAENAKQVTELLHTSEQDIFLLAVPFFHCFGCVMGIMGAIAWGASIVPMAVFKAR